MSKYRISKIYSSLIGSGIVISATYSAYDGYHKSITPSGYEIAASKLGFSGYTKNNQTVSAPQQQDALLKQLKIFGCFSPSVVWQAINRTKVENPELVFQQLYPIIKQSGADQQDLTKFDAKLLRKNLAKTTALNEKEVIDFILTLSQTTYGRKVNQERNQLISNNNLSAEEQKEYLDSATTLRLIDRETPQSRDYDEAWIAGASRIGVVSRLIDYKYTLSKYQLIINGETLILAGQRELWANIDSIFPQTLTQLLNACRNNIDIDTLNIIKTTGNVEEGKEYMEGLAQRVGVQLNKLNPFIQYSNQGECPLGRFPGRSYANYDSKESPKLTETMMSLDILSLYGLDQEHKISVIDTFAVEGRRPDTSSTARDAAEKFIAKIMSGRYLEQKEFKILLQSNNPYIERQTLSVKREIDKVLKEQKLTEKGYLIEVEGIGFMCKQGIATVKSELAALIAEKYKIYIEKESDVKHASNEYQQPYLYAHLLFHAHSDIPAPCPELLETNIIGGPSDWFKSIFDHLLP